MAGKTSLRAFLIASLSTLVAPLAASQNHGEHNNVRNKVIMDNDFGAGGWNPYLIALNAGWEVLGLTTCTTNTWMPQLVEHALGNLQFGNLSCIPVFPGALYPLVNSYEAFQAWQAVHGAIPWQGAFAPQNKTAEELGGDPTGGDDPYRIIKGAFTQGYPTTKPSSQDAVSFMIEQVHKYPGEVSIYAAGAMTNVALAVRTDPKFASLAKELVIMGGYIDNNLFQVTGDTNQANINSDINLMLDPEAAKIALTADFPKITIAGNVANQVYPDPEWIDEVTQVDNAYTRHLKEYIFYGFPFWDDIAAAIMVEPSIVLNATYFYLDVDTSYASPSYGTIHAYQKALKPPTKLQNITYVNEIDATMFKDMLKHSLQYPKTCDGNKIW